MRCAGFYMGDYRCTVGVIGTGATKTSIDWRYPITTNAVVRWRDSRQMKNERTVSLVGLYDPKVRGILTFSIGRTNVAVHFEKWEPGKAR